MAEVTTRSKSKKIKSDYSQAATTEGHSDSASSASRPFLFTGDHPLIVTSAAGDSWDSFEALDSIDDPYNLDDMFTEVGFRPQKECYSAAVKCSGGLRCGCHPIAWVKHLIEKSVMTPSLSALSYTAGIMLDAFDTGLVPFLRLLRNQPDGVVLGSFASYRNQWNLPLFILEVDSSPYKNTVSQTAADVLDQLRLLRCFNANIRECVGFAFPKYATDSCLNQTCVTKVTVSFLEFRFVVSLNRLRITDVKKEIVKTLESALRFRADFYPEFSFMRFSTDELQEAVRALRTRYRNLSVEDVQQHPTKHSMLLKSNHTFWKCVPRLTEMLNILYLRNDLDHHNPSHITLHRSIDRIGRSKFLAFPAHLPPLTKGEVSECLQEFLMMTATALEELHSFGFAHLDVRIPNICFARNDDQYTVKLIDLDRCKEDTEVGMGGYKGEMYETQSGWSASRYDWKQLGLLAAEIILELDDHRTIVRCDRVDQDECLKMLIKEGSWNKTVCEQSANVKKYQKKQLRTILEGR